MSTSARAAVCGMALISFLWSPVLAADHPDLSGDWVLDREASDDPRTVLRPPRDSGMGGGGMGGGGTGRGGMGRGGMGRGGMGRGGMGGGRPSGEMPTNRGGEDGGPAAGLAKRIGKLTIFHAGDEIDLTDGLEISRLLRTDGKPAKVWTERGQVEATASWQGESLVVNWRGGGVDRTSRFTLSGDGSRLEVLEEIVRPGGEDKSTLKLVYNRVNAASDQ